MATLLIKVATLGILLAKDSIGQGHAGRLGVYWSDTPSYFDPIESLMSGGDYDSEVRMPGYGVVYMLARLVSTVPDTYDILVVLQTLLAAASMYVLCRMIFRLTGSRAAFLLMLATYAVSISVHWYDAVILTESFATSALIFFLDRLLAWCRTGSQRTLIFAGLWLTWAIFLKPVLAPVPAFVLLGMWYGRHGRPIPVLHMFLFLVPLIVVEGTWCLRNMMKYKGFYPLTYKTYLEDDYLEPKLHAGFFVIAYGGDQIWWGDPMADVRFFNIGDDQVPGRTEADRIILPDRIMTSAYNLDSLKAISALTMAVKDTTLPDSIRQQWTDRINNSLIRYKEAFIVEHPFQYHVLSRLHALRSFVKQTGNPVAYAETFSEMPWPFKALKLFHAGMHWATLILGVAGAIFWLKRTEVRTFAMTVALTIPYGILIFPFALRLSEHRYLVLFIPFLLLTAIMGIRSRFIKPNRTDS